MSGEHEQFVKCNNFGYYSIKFRLKGNDSYGITKRIREITRGSNMCHYFPPNDLVYDRMK